MEANHRWSIRSKGKLIEVGTSWGTPRGVLEELIEGFADRCPKEDAHYTFEVADLVTSAHGSELGRTAEVVGKGLDETVVSEGGHLFVEPVKVDIDAEAKKMFDEVAREILKRTVGKVFENILKTVPVGGPTTQGNFPFIPVDPDREREKRAIKAPMGAGHTMVPCRPHEHILQSRRDNHYQGTKFWCSHCGRAYIVSDQVLQSANFPIERSVREALSS